MSRPSSNIVSVVAPTDRDLLTFLHENFKDALVVEATIVSAPEVHEQYRSAKEIEDFLAKFGEDQGQRIRKVSMRLNSGWYCDFDRGTTRNGTLEPSNFEAEFLFRRSQHGDGREDFGNLAQKIDLKFGRGSLSIGAIATDQTKAIATHISQLSSVALSITESLASAHLENQRQLEEHKITLTKQFAAEAEEREKVFLVQNEALNKRESEVDEKLAELDLSRARDARRKLRELITKDVQFKLSDPATFRPNSNARTSIVIFICVGIFFAIASATGAAYSTYINGRADADGLLVHVRFFASSALAAILLFYLVGYLKQLERDDTRFKRELEKYSLDVNRASWIVETVMEFKEEEAGLKVPEKWLEGVTNNLFGSTEADKEQEASALDSLADLLSAGARLKIGNGGAELEIDSRAARKLAKTN